MDSNILLGVISDILIVISYYMIPIEIHHFEKIIVKPFKYSYVFRLFEAFIFSCGTTHLLAAMNPFYENFPITLITAVKLITAIISLITAFALTSVFPQVFNFHNRSIANEFELLQSRSHERALMLQKIKFRSITQAVRKSIVFENICKTSVNELLQNFDCLSKVSLYLFDKKSRTYRLQESAQLSPDLMVIYLTLFLSI